MKESKATHYLLIDKCNEEIRFLFKEVTAIPLVTGRYCCDFDCVESELPTDLVNELRACAMEAKPEGDPEMPMGLDRDCFGPDAKLVTKERYDEMKEV